jgi:hypothetical protein
MRIVNLESESWPCSTQCVPSLVSICWKAGSWIQIGTKGSIYTLQSTCLSAFRTVYAHGFIQDSNFTAVHQIQKRLEDDVWMVNGMGFVLSREQYQAYLKVAKEYKEVSLVFCTNVMLTAELTLK